MIGYPAGAFFSYTLWRSVFEGAKGRAIIPPVSGTITAEFPATAAFVAVTGISGVPTTGIVGTDITLSGTVAPNNATNTTIVWSVKTANATGAEITGNTLTTTAGGTVTVTATIADGTEVGTAYTKDFEVTIIGYLVAEPEMSTSPGQTHSNWSGDAAAAEDGSWSYTTGGLRYTWADIADDDATFDIDDYDFVAVYYTASGVASTVLKQYDTSGDYLAFSGGLSNGSGSIVFEIANATGDGFTIQKYGGSDPMTLKIDKLVFYQGTRYNITLNPGDGTVTPTTMFLVGGTKIGNHLPTPVYGDEVFMGWKLGSTVLTEATVVDSSFKDATLIAAWREKQVLSPINVSFTTLPTTVGTGTAVEAITGGYKFTYGSGGYDGSWVKFTITLPEGAILADYDTLTFNMEGVGGDCKYKQTVFLAGETLPASFSADPSSGPYAVSNTQQYNAGTPQAMTLTINKGKAAALSGTIEVSIYDRSGPVSDGSSNHVGAAGTPTAYNITSVVLSQTP